MRLLRPNPRELTATSPFVLLALGLLILACTAALAENDDLTALNQQVKQLVEQGKYQEAIPIAERALEAARRTRGPEQPDTADALSTLGLLFYLVGDYAKAEPLFNEALRIRQKVLGSDHPDTLQSVDSLATLYNKTSDYAKAEKFLREALRIRQKVLGAEHPDTAKSLNNLALLYENIGEYVKAEPLFQEALRISQKVLGAEHPDTATVLGNLAELYEAMGEYAKAEPLFQEALRVRQKVLGPEYLETALSLSKLAGFYEVIGEYAKAEPLDLTAEDVSTLDLQGTWLVTLSACDTGSGEAKAGEGVMGLRRGFIQAGAQNLLMTLWPISDEFTPQIMSDFYEAAHNTGNAPEALADVQRNWLVKLRTEKGLAHAVNLAGPFIMSSQGKP
jgi:tetratricopeptide (TPR) repeat protein